MRKLILLFLIFQNISFAQNDTIKSFDVMTKTTYIDTLGQEVYYERINKTNDSLFFEDSNYRIIENKIVKYGDYYKHIRNGKLIKEEHHPKSKISEEIPVSIKEDADSYYFVPEDQDLESQLYSQFKKYCCHK
ncbi:MAG: hypothetical protein Wins2KO_04960 [Winogradskyella sp.]